MVKLYEPNYLTIFELIIQEIIFEKDPLYTGVTLIGYQKDPLSNKLISTHYFCEFDTLTNLLLFSQADGYTLIEAIADKLNDPEEELPVLLNTEKIIGGMLVIKNIAVKMYKCKEQDENGDWQEEKEAYFQIDVLDFFEEYGKEKELKNLKAKFAYLLNILDYRFTSFLEFIEENEDAKIAREKVGLKSKLLFKMAMINNRILKGF